MGIPAATKPWVLQNGFIVWPEIMLLFTVLHQSTVHNTHWFTLKVTIKCDVKSRKSSQKFPTLSGSPAMTHNN